MSSVFLIGLNLVASKGRLAIRSADHCQGQLQTPQSLRVATSAQPQWVKLVACNRAKARLSIVDWGNKRLFTKHHECVTLHMH